VAPLDRVKILFQTSNADFRQFAGKTSPLHLPRPDTDETGHPMGLVQATASIYRTRGVRGLFQGHSATLLRIFPYAGVKFMAYDWLERVSLIVLWA
jgi:solute carrier family 25 protein 16